MNIRLRLVSFFVILIILLASFSTSLSATRSDIIESIPNSDKAKNICLYNVEADAIAFSKNINERIFPGSTVKMMTGIIACEMLADRLDEIILITDDMLNGATGFNVKLKPGMSVTVENLLYGVLCGGGNDAALAVANLCGGNIDAFVAIMNDQAQAWGLKNTFFTNPTGLDDKYMYSTLSDIMIIAQKAYKNQLYLDISSTSSYVYTPYSSAEQIKFFNRNSLISTFYATGYKNPSAMGLISGNTDLGGHCVITYAKNNEQSYLCAVMGATADESAVYSYELANSILSYAFNNISYERIATKGQHICYAKVQFVTPEGNSQAQGVPCVIRDDVYSLTFSKIDIKEELTYKYYFHNNILNAPIEKGIIIGGVDIIYDGEVIGEAVLVTEQSVDGDNILLFLDNLKNFFTDRPFWLSIVFFVLIFFAYYYFCEIRFHHKNAKQLKYNNFY